MDIIKDVLEACVGTATAAPLKLKEGSSYKEIPAQLHAMLLMPFGAGKSTMLGFLPKSMTTVVEDYSYPAMLGSISKQGQFIDGFIQQAAGKCLVIDEFHSLASKSRRAMLKLLEEQRYRRTLGYKIAVEPHPIDMPYMKMSACGNVISIDYVRFSCICSGIYAPRKRIDDFAFLSRFLPIELKVDMNNIKELGLGRHSIEIKPKLMVETPVFEEYEKLWNIYFDIVKNLSPILYSFIEDKPGFLLRNCLQISRLAAYHSGSNSVVDDWERYIPYIPFFLQNYSKALLTLTEFKVMEMLKQGISASDIAQSKGISDAAVSKMATKLKGLGLLQEL